MKQRIIIPDKITQSVFDLPCVECIAKFAGVWYLKLYPWYMEDERMVRAHIGDTLEQIDDETWRLIPKKP